MIGKKVLHYQITEKLGEGGMGTVYKARDTKLEREVAIKFLPTNIATNALEKERFKREAKAAAALNHPNIATIHAIEDVDQSPFIVMEYIDGKNLHEIVEAKHSQVYPVAFSGEDEQNASPLPIETVLICARQIADGLKAAHDKGIMHRDIKPANIMLTTDGRAKIMDFGLAKFTDQKGLQLTRSSITVGTALFMSPEQIRGEAIDLRSDLWSFGVVLYEMLTGQLPFAGEYQQAVMYAILNESPRPAVDFRSDVPESLQIVLIKCLQKNADDRYQSASELLADLQKIEASPGQKIIESRSVFAPSQPRAFGNYTKYGGFATVIFLLLFAVLNFGGLKNWLGIDTIPKQKRIVVLPFNNITGGQQNQAFCNGLVEVLTSKLTQFEQFQGALLVIPSSEVRQLEIMSAKQAREHFQANLVISGSVQRTEADIRLTLNLVDAEKLRQIDSDVITDKMKGVSDFQDNVMTRLAGMLQLNLQPETRSLLAAGHTTTPGAYDFYLQGRGYLQNYDQLENIDMAIALFERALEKDSLYALAYAGLGEAVWRKHESSKIIKWADLAREKCQKALTLNNKLAPVHITLGIIYRGTGRYEESVNEFMHALEINPVSSEAFRGLADTYSRLNKTEEVEKTFLQAITLKPDYWANYYDLGLFYFHRGEYQKAEKQFLVVVGLSPRNHRAYRNLCATYIMMERYDDAQKMGEKSVAIQPNSGAYANLGLIHFSDQRYKEAAIMYEKALELNENDYSNWGNLAISYEQIPEKAHKAQEAYGRAIELAEKLLKVNPSNYKLLYSLATYYSVLKKFDKTVVYLEKALKLAPENLELMFQAAGRYVEMGEYDKALKYIEKAIQGGYSMQKIKKSASMKPLQSDQRFVGLLEKHLQNK